MGGRVCNVVRQVYILNKLHVCGSILHFALTYCLERSTGQYAQACCSLADCVITSVTPMFTTCLDGFCPIVFFKKKKFRNYGLGVLDGCLVY